MSAEVEVEYYLGGNDLLDLILHVFTRQLSAFIVLFGRRGSGKTDLGLFIMEALNGLNKFNHFATNVYIKESPFPIERISNLDDLRFWCKDNRGKKLYLFDEIGKGLKRRAPMSNLNIEIINDFQILRKYQLSVIATTIDAKFIDMAVLGPDILDGYFIKESWRNPRLASYVDYLEDFSLSFFDIPSTFVKFDTLDSAPFKRHGEKQKPIFKERDLNLLYEAVNGKTYKELGIHPQQLSRIWKKFVKEVLERDNHGSQLLEREVKGEAKG